MQFIDVYIQKCLENKSYYRKTSIKAGFILSSVIFLMNIFSNQNITASIIVLFIMWGIFTWAWFIFVKQLEKIAKKQYERLAAEKSLKQKAKRDQVRMNIKKKKKSK
ncbi:hypothetical protein ACED96_01575 [Clostridium thermobutyricum]|uniref:hypothetical protein n=1 Tax=Clostridium thermobutyricum TaxID=29372 RepID=UPI003F51F720